MLSNFEIPGISTLAIFIVRKNTCNCVTKSEMVNSVSVKQAYPLFALPISIDKIYGNTDLYVITNCISHDDVPGTCKIAQKMTDSLPIVCLYAEK